MEIGMFSFWDMWVKRILETILAQRTTVWEHKEDQLKYLVSTILEIGFLNPNKK